MRIARVLFLAWLVTMALDARRFRWSRVPLGLQVAGVLLLLLAFSIFFLTFRANPFLSPAVRLQPERGQIVVSAGPYRYVRHPMYAAMLPFLAGTTLLLGSWYGFVPALLLFGGIAARARREEATLRAELPGYSRYLAQVRHRFVPYVW
jgi:protein-S-isoprenylcysteine O-methyltransferase Ste14